MTHTNTISPVSQPASGPPTVAGVMALIEADDSLAPGRRRDWLSALRGLCRLLDRPPDTLPAFMPTLADGLAQVNLVTAGMKEKRFSNIKSDVLAAFKHCGIGQARGAGYPPLSEAWQDLYDACDHRRRSGLSRFMHICSAWGISPGAVDDGIVDRFIEALPYLAFKTEKQVRDLHRYITRLWNECAVDIAAWPATTLSVPDYHKPRTRLELSDYPASFEKDVEAHHAWLHDADPFAERRPPRRYKPRTIKLRQQYILSAASLYVQSGGKPEHLKSLADLVLPCAFR